MQFLVVSDLVVVATNPELADISNPRGEIYEAAFSVIAETKNGRRWAHDHTFYAKRNDPSGSERVMALRARIERAYAAGHKLDQRHWIEIDPCYGSEAYVEQDIEFDRWSREREDELA